MRTATLILISLVLISTAGYDWVHTLWHFRHDAGIVHPNLQAPAGTFIKTAGTERSHSENENPGGYDKLLTAMDDDNLVNTGSPFSPDKNSIKCTDWPQVFITWLNGVPIHTSPEPHLHGIHKSVFQPPKTA